MTAPRPAARNARLLLIAVVAAAATFAVYFAVCTYQFVNLDDPENFEKNAGIRGLGFEQLKWMWSARLLGVYQPIAWMAAGIEFAAAGGLSPRVFHTVNVFLHAISAALIVLIVHRLIVFARPRDAEQHAGAATWAALAAAVAFACHPLRAETVAWASAQPYALMECFSLAATVLYLSAQRPERSPMQRLLWLAAAWFFCALAMLSKAPAMMLPVAFLLLDAFPIRRFNHRPRRGDDILHAVVEKLPFLALSAFTGIAAIVASRIDETAESLESPGAVTQVAEAVVALGIGLKNTVLPIGLSPHVARIDALSNAAVPFALSAAAIALLTVAAVWLARKRHVALLVAWAAFVVLSLPSLGVIRHGLQLTADRYSYLASVPWTALLGGGLFCVFRSRTGLRAGVAIVLPAALIALGALTIRQSAFWSSSVRLWQHAVARNANSAFAHRSLAAAHLDSDQSADALEHYRRAAELNPKDIESLANIGALCMAAGRTDEALTAYQAVLALDPTHADAHNNLGVIMKARGDLDAAETHYTIALSRRPDYALAYNNFANLLYTKRNYTGAEQMYRDAVRLDPDYAEAWNGLGLAMLQLDRPAEAVACFERVLMLKPDHPDAAANLEYTRRLDAP